MYLRGLGLNARDQTVEQPNSGSNSRVEGMTQREGKKEESLPDLIFGLWCLLSEGSPETPSPAATRALPLVTHSPLHSLISPRTLPQLLLFAQAGRGERDARYPERRVIKALRYDTASQNKRTDGKRCAGR